MVAAVLYLKLFNTLISVQLKILLYNILVFICIIINFVLGFQTTLLLLVLKTLQKLK